MKKYQHYIDVPFKPLQTIWTQIRPDIMSGLTWIQLFDTLKVFLKEFFEKVYFEKKSADIKKACKITQ